MAAAVGYRTLLFKTGVRTATRGTNREAGFGLEKANPLKRKEILHNRLQIRPRERHNSLVKHFIFRRILQSKIPGVSVYYMVENQEVLNLR